MDKPATCSLDPRTYDLFFRDGPNKPHEYCAIRRFDLDRLVANLENALKAVCGTDVAAEMMACYKCDGIMFAETFRVLDSGPTHGYRCASCGEKTCPQVHLNASGVWDIAKRLRNQLVVAQAQLRNCPTCEGDGIMAAVVGHGPHDEELLEDVECEECHGTGVSSWGQAIDRAEKAEKDLKAAQDEPRESELLVHCVEKQISDLRCDLSTAQTCLREAIGFAEDITYGDFMPDPGTTKRWRRALGEVIDESEGE